MSINPKHQPQTIAPPLSSVPVQPQPARIEPRPASERNGYLDPDQTLINYCVREMGYSFDRIIQEDPNRLLRSWGKVYKKAQTTAIGTTGIGAIAVVIGVLTGATPMIVAGVLAAGGSGLLVKKHSAGVESCSIEHEMLDEFRPVLGFLAELERRGVNPSDVVSLYDRVVRRVSANPGRFSTASILERLFKDELAQSGVLAQVSGVKTGLAAVAPVAHQPAASPELPPSVDRLPVGEESPALKGIHPGVRTTVVEPPLLANETAVVERVKSLLDVVTEDPKSSFFAAPARTGKGVTIAACIRMVQSRVKAGSLEKVTIWAMTPKQDPQEHWYWETCDKFFNPDIENGDRNLAAEGIYEFIREFTALPRSASSPTILIVDEFTRLVGLLKNVKMETVAPELFARSSTIFGDWLTDKIIHSASMSQSIGFYVWVATPKATVGRQSYDKGDIGSLNVYTLATKDNLKFADGGTAAFSAPKTEATHPVFDHGYVAGYCHQTKRWYHVEDLSPQVALRSASPVSLSNYWAPAFMSAAQTQEAPSPVATMPESAEADQKASTRPNLSRTELSLAVTELSEWLDGAKESETDDPYSNWKGGKKRHGFSRPEIRFLLARVSSLD